MHLVVVGGGPAGYSGAIRAAQLGASVTLVEKNKLGGTCLNAGCIPTKAILQSAEIINTINDSQTYGITVSNVKFDWQQINQNKRLIVDRLVNGVSVLLKSAGVTIVRGQGELIDDRNVLVNKEDGTSLTIKADRILLALGSRPTMPQIPGIKGPGVIYSDDALELPKVPDSLLVVGGGVVGVELATIFSSLGTSTTILEVMPTILSNMDLRSSKLLQNRLQANGIKIFCNSNVSSIESVDNGIKTVAEIRNETHTFITEQVLIAAGRRPEIMGAGLDHVGIQRDQGFIKVNDYLETSKSGIYAAGDAIGGVMLAHVSFYEGQLAVENAIFGNKRKADYTAVPMAVYTMPELASVGLTEKQAKKKGYEIVLGRFPLMANGKAIIENGHKGFVRVIADKEAGKILGVQVAGPHATEIIGEAAVAVRCGLSIEQISSTIHPHPTINEAFAEACLAAQGKALHIAN